MFKLYTYKIVKSVNYLSKICKKNKETISLLNNK